MALVRLFAAHSAGTLLGAVLAFAFAAPALAAPFRSPTVDRATGWIQRAQAAAAREPRDTGRGRNLMRRVDQAGEIPFVKPPPDPKLGGLSPFKGIGVERKRSERTQLGVLDPKLGIKYVAAAVRHALRLSSPEAEARDLMTMRLALENPRVRAQAAQSGATRLFDRRAINAYKSYLRHVARTGDWSQAITAERRLKSVDYLNDLRFKADLPQHMRYLRRFPQYPPIPFKQLKELVAAGRLDKDAYLKDRRLRTEVSNYELEMRKAQRAAAGPGRSSK